MVCPIVAPGGKRSVYLPQGTKWYDWNTTKCYEGGQKIQVEMPLDQIPVFVRAGSVIPLQEPGANTDEMKNKEITLCVYSGRDGYFRMYEDAGDGYGYEDGDYCITDISWQEKTGSLHGRAVEICSTEIKLIPTPVSADEHRNYPYNSSCNIKNF